MARANRHRMPGHVWHITHRCHKREFLLKFVENSGRRLQRPFEAEKRDQSDILNHTVTFEPIHLLRSPSYKRVHFACCSAGRAYAMVSVCHVSGGHSPNGSPSLASPVRGRRLARLFDTAAAPAVTIPDAPAPTRGLGRTAMLAS